MSDYTSFFKKFISKKTFKNIVIYSFKLLIWTLLLSLPLWGTDYILNWMGFYIDPYFHKDSFFLAVLLAFFLLQVRNNTFFYIFFTALLLIIYANFFHFSFFGRFFTGYDIALFFTEYQDTALAFFDDFINYWYLFLVTFLGFILMLCVRIYSRKQLKQSNWFILPVILSLIVFPMQNIKRGGEFILPNSTQFVYFNGLKSISSYFIDVLIVKKEQKSFLPYKVELKNSPKEPTTIVYVIGESLSASHLSLFGYERKTTPNLEKWAKERNLYYTQGIAGATATRTSISRFMNFQKEPENYILAQSKKHNLFKLAQQASFKTTFMSAQSFSAFPHVGLEYTDYYFHREKQTSSKAKGDDFWLEQLKTLPLSEKNFIVIQMRAIHSPYLKTWRHRFDEFNHFSGKNEKKFDDYDNGILYVDFLLNETLEWVQKIPGNVYVFFASDHNELFGEYGIYGHITLHQQVAQIPVLVWTNNWESIMNFKTISNPSHWEIGRQLLNLMGYQVENPNSADDTIFIQGSDPMATAGFITLKRKGDKLIQED